MGNSASEMDGKIVKCILDSLNNGEITFTEAQTISKFFLLNSDNKTDMYAFLETLSGKWNIFQPLFAQAKTQTQYSKEDEAKLEQIKKQLAQFTQS